MAKVFLFLIRLYQLFISPLLGQHCRFQPSCSAYTQEAIARYGAVSGGWLGLKRLARCHPIGWLGAGSGFDPVPDRTHLTKTQKKE